MTFAWHSYISVANMKFEKEIKTPYLLGSIGVCLVVAVLLAYIFAPHLLKTQIIEDAPITIDAGTQASDDGGVDINKPPQGYVRPTLPKQTTCAEVITPAKNPDTQEIRDFPTPCDVPKGWQIIPR